MAILRLPFVLALGKVVFKTQAYCNILVTFNMDKSLNKGNHLDNGDDPCNNEEVNYMNINMYITENISQGNH